MTVSPLWRCLRRCLLGLVFSALAGAAFAQNYDTGMRAYDAGNYAKALEIWGPLAEGGDSVAQYSLGKLLENGGKGVARDVAEAAKWYRRSANQGVSAAENNLGLMYAQGRGVPRNVVQAAQLWHSAAEKNHVIAQFNLGLAYFRGEGVKKNQQTAIRWLRRAGDLGLANAQYAMGQVIRMGQSAEADESEALGWYDLAAAQGHDKAQIQAERLRQAGVKGKAPAAQAATAAVQAPAPPPQPIAQAPAPPPTPAAKPKPAEPPAREQIVTPKARPAQAQMAAVIAAPVAPPEGPYRIWLISTKDQAEAGRFLEAARARHPEIFAEAPGAVAPAKLGKAGVFHRVVAGGLPSRQAARDLCRRLRAKEPAAFCKVLAN